MLAKVDFDANGQPKDDSTSNSSAVTIFSNADNSACPDSCFRPAGVTFDPNGRAFMSSDASGEIYVVAKNGDSKDSSGTGGSGNSTGSGGSSGSGGTNAAASLELTRWYFVVVGFSLALSVLY